MKVDLLRMIVCDILCFRISSYYISVMSYTNIFQLYAKNMEPNISLYCFQEQGLLAARGRKLRGCVAIWSLVVAAGQWWRDIPKTYHRISTGWFKLGMPQYQKCNRSIPVPLKFFDSQYHGKKQNNELNLIYSSI